MQDLVQDDVLRSLDLRAHYEHEIVSLCPKSEERDVRRAIQLLWEAHAITRAPHALTAFGRRRRPRIGLAKGRRLSTGWLAAPGSLAGVGNERRLAPAGPRPSGESHAYDLDQARGEGAPWLTLCEEALVVTGGGWPSGLSGRCQVCSRIAGAAA